MRSTALPLTAFKIAVRGGCATLAGLQTIGVHGQTHRASWFAPLEAGLNKYLVQTFLFGLQLDQARARHHHGLLDRRSRSEEHTSELQSLMRISYAVFCLQNKKY